MRRSFVFVLLLVLIVLAACRKEAGWIDFEGIQYRAPHGTAQRVEDGVLPGPGGQGGIPSGVRVEASITKPNPNGLFVQIVRTAEPASLDGTKQSLSANHVGREMKGATTQAGWELTYEQLDANGAPVGNVHMVYRDIGGGHYQCTWGEANCADRAGADAICRSMRAKP